MNKNVIFFIDSLSSGGAERVISVLSAELSKRGYSIEIVLLRKEPIAYKIPEEVKIYYAEDLPIKSNYGRLVRKFSDVYFYIRRRFYIPLLRRLKLDKGYPKWNETSLYFYARFAMPYREFLKKREGSTAFGFLIRSNISLIMASSGIRVRKVFCERNNPVRPDIAPGIIKIRDKVYHKFDAGVFQTPEEMEYYHKLKGNKKVIPNPVKNNLPERFEKKRRHEIVNFCRLSQQKRIDLLLQAFKLFSEDYPDYTLRVYGKGEEKQKLLDYIQQSGMQGKAYIEDFAADIHDRIVDSAMFVSTSDYEGISNSMIEALAIGLPCVCTDCDGGGAGMMIKDHRNGLLVPKGDIQAIYKGMKEIAADEQLAEQLSINAYQTRYNLDVNKIVDEWIGMI